MFEKNGIIGAARRKTGSIIGEGGKGMRTLLNRASGYMILFMVLSFLGWAVETVFFWFLYGKLCDRGFMTLPFCTIYGFALLIVYMLIGTPKTGGLLLCKAEGKGTLPIYLLLSALIPTALELLTGLFFDRLFGVRLWSYSACRFHFHGYICLEYALLWGLLIPLSMKFLVLPMRERVFSIPLSYRRLVAATLAWIAVMDWTVNFSRQSLVFL